jgi:biopolymer transport protein ExbD
MRYLRLRDTSEDATYDLNIVPMMDMFVSIIPFLLLSAVFMTITLIDVPLPAPVAQALQQDRDGLNKEVTIRVNMDQKTGISIEVRDMSGKSTHMSVPKSGQDYDFKALHKKFVEIKQRHPKTFKIELNPHESVEYKSIVQVMDAARNMEKEDPKILIENAETPLLFPDVILSNLMG